MATCRESLATVLGCQINLCRRGDAAESDGDKAMRQLRVAARAMGDIAALSEASAQVDELVALAAAAESHGETVPEHWVAFAAALYAEAETEFADAAAAFTTALGIAAA